MNARTIYNASFTLGGLRHRLTRPAYTSSEMVERVSSLYPGATDIVVSVA